MRVSVAGVCRAGRRGGGEVDRFTTHVNETVKRRVVVSRALGFCDGIYGSQQSAELRTLRDRSRVIVALS